MIITNQQLKAFQQVSFNTQGFVDYMLTHLKKHFPVQSRLLQDERLTNFIKAGMVQAGSWGFVTTYQYCLFIDVMVMLGSGFDSDIQIQWFRQILERRTLDADDKIDLLYQETMTYLDAVVGKGMVFPMKQLEYMANLPESKMAGQKPGPGFEEDLVNELSKLWPQKYHASGKANLIKLVASGIQQAGAYGLKGENSIAYFIHLQFVFGHQIDKDPLYPWVRELMEATGEYSEEKKYILLQECVRGKLLEGIQDEMALF
jgi:hypothetical protein